MNIEAFKNSDKQDRIVYVRPVMAEDLPSELRNQIEDGEICLLYTSPSPRDR